MHAHIMSAVEASRRNLSRSKDRYIYPVVAEDPADCCRYPQTPGFPDAIGNPELNVNSLKLNMHHLPVVFFCSSDAKRYCCDHKSA